ncbi:MAG: aminomethyl-transferring glycine dehydrogenase subunit GcvPB [Acidimicrobiia bacterium]|nr:aminomethyl-transferring glycine dehydrogenase subunit GcvPB [Acidimicrobiia bacterium]
MPKPGGSAASSPLVGGSEEPTLKEISVSGRRAWSLAPLDVPEIELDLPEKSEERVALPEVSEHDLVMHYTRLSHRNFAVDLGAYPLGSCTMKYNPKVCDWAAEHPAFRDLHPATPASSAQGALAVLVEAERYLCEITGMDRATFQPPAGASGELTGLLLMRAYHEDKGEERSKILIPDAAHGTNPASVTLGGYQAVEVPSNDRGMVDVEALRGLVDGQVAGLMLTNPNTLGLFEENIVEIAEIVHEAGGLVYYDGANLNAIMGVAKPGLMGFDIVHSNLHKTFATPHGGGGPGAGPVAVHDVLVPFLPGPLPEAGEDGVIRWVTPAKSIGRVHGKHGNFGVVLRALAYMKALGGDGLRRVSERAVLNARYLEELLRGPYDLPYDSPCMHEFVASAKTLKKSTGIRAMDIVKALMDEGFHAPTVYFPLIVDEALMMEPTETQSMQTMDALAAALLSIADRAATEPDALHAAPVNTPVGRPDEASAARHLRVTWRNDDD